MLKVLGIGDNVCDIYISSNEMYPGGQALNFTVYAKKLGADSAYIGVFGNDEIAEHVINTLDLLEIEHTYCRQYEGENGYAVAKLVNGDRIFLKSNRGGISKENPILLNSKDKDYVKSFDFVHTSNNSYFNNQLNTVYEWNIPISYDFSYKWEEWHTTKSICPYLDYAFLSCGSMSDEETKDICKEIHELGCNIAIGTMGSKGAWLYDGELMLFQKPKIVEAVDTLGAGDSFAAGFLVNYLKEKKINFERMKNNLEFREKVYKQALNRASEFAAEICLVRGAFGYAKEVPESIKKALKDFI